MALFSAGGKSEPRIVVVGGGVIGVCCAYFLARRVLSDSRVHVYPAGRGDLASGRVDPRVIAVIGPMPERAYDVTLAFNSFMYVNAASSPMSCTSVASIRYAVPEEFGGLGLRQFELRCVALLLP
jgi:hypothetical protein